MFRVRQKARQHEGTTLKGTTRKIAGTLETSFTGGGEKGATRRDVHRLLPLQLVPPPKERVPGGIRLLYLRYTSGIIIIPMEGRRGPL